jgi:hypothetical protein
VFELPALVALHAGETLNLIPSNPENVRIPHLINMRLAFVNPCHRDRTGGASRAFPSNFPVNFGYQRHHGCIICLGVAVEKLAQPTDGQVAGPVSFSHGTDPITDSKNATTVRYSKRSNWMIQQHKRIFIADVFFSPAASTPATGSWRPIQHSATVPRIRPEAKLGTVRASTL